MPYVITIKEPVVERGDPAVFGRIVEGVTSRQAVATLEEAREQVLGMRGVLREQIADVSDLTEQGGTIGPLPDGTVIEVERKSGYAILQMVPAGQRPHRERGGSDMHRERGGDDSAYLRRIIDAYNERGTQTA